METIVASVSALLGVGLGAVLQWLFSRREGRESRLDERQAEAYSRFLVWDRAGLDGKSIAEACRARTFLTAYGSRKTIKALATFERLGGVVCTAEQKLAFANMFNALRADRGLPSLDQEDILTVMYLDDGSAGTAARKERSAFDANTAAA